MITKYPSLNNRHVFITGGASGIGASMVEGFVSQGSLVSFVDIADGSDLCHQLVQQYPNAKLFFQQCDLRNIEQLRLCIDNAHEKWGPIRALVNNAAKDERHEVSSVTPEFWDNCQAVNLRHHFFCAQRIHPLMAQAGGGSIINLSSNSYLLKVGGMPGYLTAKAAIVGLTRALARDFGPDKIRVNSVLPGWVMTQRQVDLWLTKEAEAELLESQCLKEKMYPPDVSNLVLFLAADDSRMITGQSHIIDGGRV